MNGNWWRALGRLPGRAWQELRRLPGLLAAPRPDPVKQTNRIIAIQRNLVFPAKLLIIVVVFYYLYYARWYTLGEVETSYGVVLQKMQRFFAVYVLVNIAAVVSFFVVRQFLLSVAQGIVFAVGLVDGLFLGGLLVLTNGFESDLYWFFAGLIVVNAICIPLAVPQIVLNLLLTLLYLGAGMVETNVRSATERAAFNQLLAEANPGKRFTAANFPDREFRSLVYWLRRQQDALSQYVWRRLSATTRQQLSVLSDNQVPDAALKEAFVAELNQLFSAPRATGTDTDSAESPVPAQAVRLQLVVLWLLTFCCYGVQLLAARQRQAQEEQQEFLSRSGQLRAAGRLAAEIAHKVKNPLGIINTAAFSLQKALREGRNVSPQQVAIIQEEVERSDRIITQVMGYATLTEGRVEKLDVTAELDRAIEGVFPPGAGFAIEVQREIPAELPSLWMQPAHFNEILVNILQNAREALNGVGQVTVIARLVQDMGLEVIVEDNGPGIAADKLERIFEPYFSMREKGTGLGLAIVRHNVELYGGTVRAESTLGKGARFRVFFPARSSLDAGS